MFYYSKIDSVKIELDEDGYRFKGEIPTKMVAHEWCLLCKEIELPKEDVYCNVMGERKSLNYDNFEDPILVVSFVNEYQEITNFRKFTTICDEGFSFGNYHYSYLVTSGSALKHQEMWFYRDDLNNPRNMWKINYKRFVEKKTQTKAMLYEGLWLTSCNEWENFPHDKVCCLPDLKINITTNGMYVSNDGKVSYVENWTTLNNVNDGMGWIRKSAVPELVLESKGGAFQFRGPWCKGLLRIVDDSYFQGERYDVWKRKINLADYDIIFSDSVFKGACGYDSMKEFMDQKPTFGYVIPCTKQRTLNYQILNPLNLTVEERKALSIKDRRSYAELLYKQDQEFEFNTNLIVKALKALALQNLPLENLTTGIVAKTYSNILDGRKRRLLGGRWDINNNEVKALNAYLNCDPYFYFTGVEMLQPNEVCDKRFKDGELVAIARNPQISVHEWVLARNRITADAAYGVVDLPARSAMAQTLSGADYDGDQVLVTNHPIIIRALQRVQIENQKRYGNNSEMISNLEEMCEIENQFRYVSMPILFDEPAKKNVPFWEAAWGEFNNNEFTIASNNATRAYLKFRNDPERKEYYGCLFSAQMQVGIDMGKYQYKMPEYWSKVKKEFQKKHYPLSPESFYWKRDYANIKSYHGIIDKKFGQYYTINPDDSAIDTVKRDTNNQPIGQKRYTPKGCNEKVMTEHWKIIVNTYREMITQLENFREKSYGVADQEFDEYFED